MAVITEGKLALIDRSPVFRAVGLEFMPGLNGLLTTYDAIYTSQPAVRAVVDFLAKNLAQLRIKAYRRVSDTHREFLGDHPVQLLLDFPSGRFNVSAFDPGSAALSIALANDPQMGKRLSRSKFFRGMWSDYLIFDRVLLVKVRDPRTDRVRALVRIPARMYATVGRSWIAPDGFKLRGSGNELDVLPQDAVYITGYNPNSNTQGTSPLEALRRTLAEDSGMDAYRQAFWNNAARYSNVIERPLDAPQWKPEARERFLEKWRERGSGVAVGGTGMLEEGMRLRELSLSNGDVTSYVSSRKLSNEEVARVFGLPRALVDMLDTGQGPFAAGIESYREFLYSDVLAPILPIASEQFELDLLAEFEPDAGVTSYLEYDLDEKLRGQFETAFKAAQASVGRPWVTVNEQRSMENRPPIDGGDELTVPFNVGLGMQASPQDSAPPEVAPPGTPPKTKSLSQLEDSIARSRDRYAQRAFEVLGKFFDRQRRSVLSSKKWSDERWDRELGDIIFGLAQTFAADAAAREAARSGEPFDETLAFGFIDKHSRAAAASINFVTGQLLDSVGDDATARKSVFEKLASSRGREISKTLATAWGSFGTREPAYQNGNAGKKKWITTDADSRHAALDGEVVEMTKTFSNGGQYPGDFKLPTPERANCACVLVVT